MSSADQGANGGVKKTSAFYRYIRPVLFDEKRIELVTQKKGGVCFRFEIDGNSIWFTHSRCKNDELFSKEVAKKIADERAKFAKEKGWNKDGFCGAFQITKDTLALCRDVVYFGLEFAGKTDHEDMLMQYWALEYLDLSCQLHFMLVSNQHQEQKLKDWKTSIEAAKFREMYGDTYYDPHTSMW
jgi:hypothetical protein